MMMNDAKVTPFDGVRTGCDAGLRLLALGQDWRREWHALIGRRIERDCDATQRLQEALADTSDWSTFGEAVQRMLRDYVIASVEIWRDAGDACLRAQYESATAWRKWLREYQTGWLDKYQTDWLPDLSRLAVVNEASMPWRDWMEALEQGMTAAIRQDGAAAVPEPARRRAGVHAAQESVPVK
ncbi:MULTISPECIES: hypothetical protein [Burkholderia]|uniref:hypothetical protein n=1 Tax=Burkholderia TaxID=32008 RepID=UPI000A516D11|nr:MULTISPECIES: hypothetical protein [Burkholderia]